MANVATPQTAISMAMSTGQQGFSQVTPVICTFDTIDSDLTVFTPSISTNHAAIIAMFYQEADAHTLTLKAGGTTYVTLQRNAYDGAGMPLGTGGFMIVGGKGQALAIRCGTAAIATMIIYCVEFPSLNFGGVR